MRNVPIDFGAVRIEGRGGKLQQSTGAAMAAKAKISREFRKHVLSVIQARQALPTDKQLANQAGVSVSAIRQTMSVMLAKLYVCREPQKQESASMEGSDRPNSPIAGP